MSHRAGLVDSSAAAGAGALLFALGAAAGCVLGYAFASKGGPRSLPSLHDIASASSDPAKLVLCVRMDLKMGKGKIGAQCGHASVGAVRQADQENASMANAYEMNGTPKIVVKLKDLRELEAIERAAQKANVLTYVVHDAGRTQIAPGSATVLAVGPAPTSVLDKLTGHLKLL